jgi:midasin (ATPase involved in ribosome maturation)
MVLGERLRSAEERALVADVLQSVMRVSLDMQQVCGMTDRAAARHAC